MSKFLIAKTVVFPSESCTNNAIQALEAGRLVERPQFPLFVFSSAVPQFRDRAIDLRSRNFL
ncbi:hypothetical protein IQ270_02020 [Microcoleus sp. LEGE 07076]|uniref:hypothetical protein n=1 Tax=Microcoleus sp. LEGE 07076 TaxID=915322 RepID=UPI00188254D4|nr:hypothetical protein [Microcoleus sp. LEGE 07076]MBE9183536.1 hypothetical protein [Microcoleus sp. LEGE 07076]